MRRKEEKSAFRYFGRVTKDLYTAMPMEISVYILLEFLKSAAAFLQIWVTARFFDAAGKWLEGGVDREGLLRNALFFVAAVAAPQVFNLAEAGLKNIPMYVKHHFLIHKLNARVVSVPLVCLEEPEFHNELWRAKMCVYNSGLIQYFFGFVDLLPLMLRFAGTIFVIAEFHIDFIPLALVSIIPSLAARFRYQREQYSMRRAQTPVERRRDYLWEVLTGTQRVKELRTMGTETYIREKWAQARDRVLDENFSFEMKNADRFLKGDLCKLFGVTASIALSIYLVDGGRISLGQFAACIAAFGSLQFMAEGVVNLFAWQKGRAAFVGDYYDFFDHGAEKEDGEPYGGLRDGIELRDVSFRYPKGEKEVLSGVSFHIRKGERVVIVGENGSGKTTLSKVLAGIYSPLDGQVLYDGKDAACYSRDGFYKKFSVVQQNFARYQFTMRENIGISMAAQIHNDSRLTESARAADIGEVVRRIGGLDTQLGKEFDGVELSGGEWQKVAVARGLNRAADVVILDEPTSALDPLVEYDILKKFLTVTEGKTSIIISHRIGLCRFADRVIVMKDGRVAESGTHKELLAAGGEYARMWHEQAKWYE